MHGCHYQIFRIDILLCLTWSFDLALTCMQYVRCSSMHAGTGGIQTCCPKTEAVSRRQISQARVVNVAIPVFRLRHMVNFVPAVSYSRASWHGSAGHTACIEACTYTCLTRIHGCTTIDADINAPVVASHLSY